MLIRKLLLGTVITGSLALVVGHTIQAGPKLSAVNLSVVIENTLSDGVTATTIQGDGSPYVNGQDGVTMQISSSGTPFGNFWTSDIPNRDVSFTHTLPLAYPSPETVHPELVFTPPTGPINVIAPRFATNLAGSTQTPLQNLAIGATQCLKMWWANDGPRDGSGITGWRDNFHMNDADTADSLAAYVVAKRTGTKTWTLESNKGAGGPCPNPAQNANQDSVGLVLHNETIPSGKGHSTTTYIVKDGYYFMPFRMTLTSIP